MIYAGTDEYAETDTGREVDLKSLLDKHDKGIVDPNNENESNRETALAMYKENIQNLA